MRVPEQPEIEGWDVKVSEDGTTWTGHRRSLLSERQVLYGCRSVISADSFTELHVAAVGEIVKASIIAIAEQWRGAGGQGCCDAE